MSLAHVLNAWRQNVAIERYGVAVFKEVGSDLILPDQILERLVDCAHWGKIRSLEDLKREVDWGLVDELGPTVVKLINTVSPPCPRARATRMAPTPGQAPPSRAAERRPLATNSRILNVQRSVGQQSSAVTVRSLFALVASDFPTSFTIF